MRSLVYLPNGNVISFLFRGRLPGNGLTEDIDQVLSLQIRNLGFTDTEIRDNNNSKKFIVRRLREHELIEWISRGYKTGEVSFNFYARNGIVAEDAQDVEENLHLSTNHFAIIERNTDV